MQDYLKVKREDIAVFNTKHTYDEDCLVNGRRITNVGTYRAYVVAYLRQHPMINQGMTFLVRQLSPTPQGLPIEIYVFSKDKVWANYESIQADIFDHLLAVMPQFDLRVFQQPAGTDLRMFAGQKPG
jgi:miniconductance mechanosensitive channel